MSLTKWHFSAEKWHMFSSVKFALKSCGVRKFSVMLCNLHSNPWVFWCNEKQYFLSIVSLKKKSRCIPLSLYWKQSAKVLTFQHKRPGFAVGLGNNYLNFFFIILTLLFPGRTRIPLCSMACCKAFLCYCIYEWKWVTWKEEEFEGKGLFIRGYGEFGNGGHFDGKMSLKWWK